MADFHSFGIIPLWSDVFRSIVSGLLRNSANSKISFGCILSGPEDLFVFRLLSFFSTASTGDLDRSYLCLGSHSKRRDVVQSGVLSKSDVYTNTRIDYHGQVSESARCVFAGHKIVGIRVRGGRRFSGSRVPNGAGGQGALSTNEYNRRISLD